MLGLWILEWTAVSLAPWLRLTRTDAALALNVLGCRCGTEHSLAGAVRARSETEGA